MQCPRCQHDNPSRAKFCEEGATPLTRTCTNGGTQLSATANLSGMFLRAFALFPLKATIHEGEIEPPRGWSFPDYGVPEPAPVLVYSVIATLPVRIITLMCSSLERTDPPSVQPLVESGVLWGLSLDDGYMLRVDQIGA